MDKKELRMRIARLKREKKEEEERRGLRRLEREAIGEAREAKRERRAAGIGLAFEKAKVYKALPLPRLRREDEEERIARAERRAKEAEAKARKQIALSQRRTEVSRARREAVQAEAKQRAEEKEAKRTRLLTERELRRERLRPYTETAEKVGKGVGKVVFGLGREAVRGVQKLGAMGEEYGRKHPLPKKESKKKRTEDEEQPIDIHIDLGI